MKIEVCATRLVECNHLVAMTIWKMLYLWRTVLAVMTMRLFCVLLLVAGQISAYGQQAWHWKEYVYERDGFAVTLPQAPNPHTDPTLPSATVYTIHLSAEATLSIRIPVDPGDRRDVPHRASFLEAAGKQT